MTDQNSKDQKTKKLSTTALAKLLNMDLKALFELLVNRKWITRTANLETGKIATELTKKGEFEGGEYLHSKKFGTYIVWPNHLQNHRIFAAIAHKTLSSASLSKALFNSPPNQLAIAPWRMNLILVELGWLSKTVKGWQLTTLGKALGGTEQQQENTGQHYALWPEQLVKHTQLQKLMAQLHSPANSQGLYVGLDGHQLKGNGLRQIDNWLYTAGLVHAYERSLPEGELISDFYLPTHQLYIDYWGYERIGEQKSQLSESAWLKGKMANKKVYEKLGLRVLAIEPNHLLKDGLPLSLDEVLPKRLLAFDIQV